MSITINKIGFYAGVTAFVFNAAFVMVQSLQLLGVLTYPYDEILIFSFSLGIVIPFLIEMLALHYATADDKKIWSHAALIFSIIYAVFVIGNYVVQLATVIPMTVKGNGDEVRILSQTPHSMFWDYDAIGYIFMALAMLFASPVFEKSGIQRWVRIAFLANVFVTPLIVFVYFYPVFSERLLLLALPWTITAPAAMLMLALMFRKKGIKKTL